MYGMDAFFLCKKNYLSPSGTAIINMASASGTEGTPRKRPKAMSITKVTEGTHEFAFPKLVLGKK